MVFKKFFTYPLFLVLFLSFVGMMGFGAIVKYHYDGGKKFNFSEFENINLNYFKNYKKEIGRKYSLDKYKKKLKFIIILKIS